MVAVSLKKIFFKQKTAYEIHSSDWSSDVCSSDLTLFPYTTLFRSVRYYAASKVLQPEPVSNDELAKRLAFVSSLQVGDAQSVLVQLPDIIADYLASGRTVNIKGLGNFFPSITSEPVERIEDCTADKVRISRICFRAAGSFMQRVCRHLDLFSFQVQELKKELKKK